MKGDKKISFQHKQLCSSTLSVLSGLPERQPHRAVRTTAARNKHCQKLTSRKIRSCDLWNLLTLK